MRERKLPKLHKQLAVAIVACIGGWDPHTLNHLASQPIERLLDPVPVLSEISASRGWTTELRTLTFLDAWSAGIKAILDGTESVHSAALTLYGLHDEINRRLWKAEIAIMLPFVEEARRTLLSRLKGIIRLPYVTSFGETIINPLDLEIGHIYYQVRGNPLVDPQLQHHIELLRTIRNRLSHLDTLPLDFILSEEISFFV